jgi:oligopeptide/dipeptide ABC transporter ATP-binding protein
VAIDSSIVLRGDQANDSPFIEVFDLQKRYPVRQGALRSLLSGDKRRVVRAVDGVTFTIAKGASVGLAGESGCGKTTTARLLLKLTDPTDGSIRFDGRDITHIKGAELKAFRRRAQLIFQNPFEALNPRFTILRSIMEPLIVHGIGTGEEREQLALDAMEKVNLRPVEAYADRYPAHLSGGQLQRVVLARALVLGPEFLVADEPVSMLDVSIRAGVLNLMRELSRSLGLTTLYISHDLSLIRYMCDYTGIMYLGVLVEWGPTEMVISDPKHPYTRALISAVPALDPDLAGETLEIGDIPPDPTNLPKGCRFHNRCPLVMDICREASPPEVSVAPGHRVACHLFK